VKAAPSRRSAWLVRATLAVALVAATSPAWRVVLLDASPTLDDLLQLRCLGGRLASPRLAAGIKG
jgi:hypothetical protein